MPDLQYTIKTVAELAGAQQALASLDRQIGALKAMKGEMSEINALQGRRDVIAQSLAQNVNITEDLASASGKLTGQLEDTAVSTSKLTGLNRELRSAMLAISTQSPLLGGALGSVFLGPIGAIVGAIALFHEAKKAIEDYNKSLDEKAAAAAQSFDDSYAHMQTAVEDLISAHAKLTAEVAGAGKDKDPIGTAIKNQNQLYAEQLDAIKKIIEAHDKLLGMTPAQIQADMASLDSKKKQHNEASLVTEYLQRDAQQNDLEQKAYADQKVQAEAKVKVENQETERARLDKVLGKQRSEINAAAQKLQDTPQTITFPSVYLEPSTTVTNADYAPAQNKLQSAQKDLERTKARLAQLKKEEAATKEAQTQADKNASASGSAATENQTRLGELSRQIQQAQALDTARAATGAEGTSISIADMVAGGKSTTPEQKQFLIGAASNIAGHSLYLSKAVTVMETAAKNHDALIQQVTRLTPILAKLDPAATSRLQAEIDRLDRELANANSRSHSQLTQ